MELVFFIASVIGIIIGSGLMSGTEAALLSLNIAKVKEYEKLNSKNNIKDRAVDRIYFIKENLQYYISVLVVLNNIINIGGSMFIGLLATRIFGDVYIGIFSAGLTLAIIIFSEVIPKVIGERHCLKVTLKMSQFLMFFGIVFRPLIFIIESFVGLLIKDDSQENVSKGEIREMAILGTQEGSLDNYEGELIDNVFELNETAIYDIMVPRHKIETIELSTSFQEILKLVKEKGYTRFPIDKDSDIIGFIHVKDLFEYVDKVDEFSVKKIMRQLVFVPEVMKVVNVERKLKSSRSHMCGIVNEHGEVSGIITFEDIVEEIFGEIEDEHDLAIEDLVIKVKDGIYHISGECEISKLNEELDITIDDEGDYSTLNGFIIEMLGRLPNLREEIKINEGLLRVISLNKKKILKVEFKENR